MPEQFSQQPQQPNNPQNVEVVQSDSNLTSQAPNQQTPKSRGGIIIFILLLVGAIVGFIVGGSFTIYLGQRGYLGDIGLASAYFMIIPILIFAGLSVFAYKGIKSLNKNYKIFGYISLFVIALSLVFSVLLFYLDYKDRQAEIAAIPSKLDFQIYRPSQNHPFDNLSEGHLPINEDLEIRCRGIAYSYYGSTDGFKLVELKANELGCPDFSYTNQEKYDEALKAAKENTTFDENKKVSSKDVGDETVLLVTREKNGKSWISDIYGLKDATLIVIQVGSCTRGTECEDKFLDFYKLLEPVTEN